MSSVRQLDQSIIDSEICVEYLAPEVLLGEAYSYEVDAWSCGTLLFEMLAGVVSLSFEYFSSYSDFRFVDAILERIAFGDVHQSPPLPSLLRRYRSPNL